MDWFPLQNSPPDPSAEGFSSLSVCSSQAQGLPSQSNIPTKALPLVPFHQSLLIFCGFLLFVAFLVYLLSLIVEFIVSLCCFWPKSESSEDEEYDGYSEVSEYSEYSDKEYNEEYDGEFDAYHDYSEYSETEMEPYEDLIEDKMSIDMPNDDIPAALDAPEDIPICSYCCEPFNDDEEPILPCDCKMYSCHRCIRTIFMLACQDEMSMPPRCCKPIPLAIGRMTLTPQEVELYKEKHDEWSTADRCYCPLPTCSAFLPPRLFPELSTTQQSPANVSEDMEPDPWNTGPPPRPIINCPKCTVAICVKCVQVVHAKRDCARDDGMTPELANALDRIGSKRCPKCRAAVRKTYGCGHMRCRCGARWCWHCYQSVPVCEQNGCAADGFEGVNGDGYFSDEDPNNAASEDDIEEIIEHDDQDLSMDDGDVEDEYDDGHGEIEWTGQMHWNHTLSDSLPSTEYPTDEGDYDSEPAAPRDINDFNSEWNNNENEDEDEAEANPGPEPDTGTVNPFDCTHKWKPLEDYEVDTSLEYECEHCWRHIYPSLTPISELQSSIDADHELETPMAVFDILTDIIMLQCEVCYMMVCNPCRNKH